MISNKFLKRVCATAAANLLFVGAVAAQDVVIRNATVMTVAKGTLENADVWVRGGKIAGVAVDLEVPAGTPEVEASGRFVTPGIIDPHSHVATDMDVNEMSNPVTPEMRTIDALNPTSRDFGLALAGGTTTQMILPGSGNLIGGQGVVVKNRVGDSLDRMVVADAPVAVKFAIGENPVRTYGARKQLPSSRMGTAALLRKKFADLRAADPARDTPGDKVLRDLINGRAVAHIHAYRAGEMLTLMEIAREAGFTIRAFHHSVEAYKIGPQLAKAGIAAVVWSDWYGVKPEAWEGIPWNANILTSQGVRSALHSDALDITRRMNLEAAKLIQYGLTPEQALKTITLDAAWVIGLEKRLGSIEVGKDGDLVIWNQSPFSVAARADAVYIEGQRYFTRDDVTAGEAQ